MMPAKTKTPTPTIVNTAYSAPGRAPATALGQAGEIGLAAAAGTAAAAVVMVQLAPGASVMSAPVQLLENQQLAVAAFTNLAVTTLIATLTNVLRNWRYTKTAT